MNSLALDYGLISRYRDARELDQKTYLLRTAARRGQQEGDTELLERAGPGVR